MARVLTDLAELQRGAPTVVTIGAFDGVHRGHQYLMRRVIDRARHTHQDSLIVTFAPRPTVVLRPGSVELTGAAEKTRLIAALGPDLIVLLPFTAELAHVPADRFLDDILEHVNVQEIWVGADFAFGHNRAGNVDFLIGASQEAGFDVHVVARQTLAGARLSSTEIRRLVERGDVDEAAALLGHYFRLAGTVVTGFGRGSELGFPTANVEPEPSQMLPGTGIYAAYVSLDGERLPAAVSVGYNPTFGGERVVVEGYILDWRGDLRGKAVTVDFVSRIREERRFDGVEALVAQMRQDVDAVRQLLATAHEPGELLLPR
ncbi:MAG TPA: bifunctional riboflavin kinase/FAD synthetase [Chloroflexota bacterium]|nr:bifunctional riboflavin kinase/FAD synthetase [Chloroflexota bacterium]